MLKTGTIVYFAPLLKEFTLATALRIKKTRMIGLPAEQEV